MKYETIRDMSNDELVETLLRLRKSHMDLRFQMASGQLEKPSELRLAKKDIARIKTEMTGRTLTQKTSAPKTQAPKTQTPKAQAPKTSAPKTQAPKEKKERKKADA